MGDFKSKAERTLWNYKVAQVIYDNELLYQHDRRKNIVDQLFIIMHNKGIRNIDMADRTGLSESSVSRIMKGDHNLTLDTIYKLADSVEEELFIKFGKGE